MACDLIWNITYVLTLAFMYLFWTYLKAVHTMMSFTVSDSVPSSAVTGTDVYVYKLSFPKIMLMIIHEIMKLSIKSKSRC